MPYIKDRDRFEELVHEIWCNFSSSTTPGDLNYLFSMIIKSYIHVKDESYQTYNDIIGALENTKLELYRRKIGNYEDSKIKENGDV